MFSHHQQRGGKKREQGLVRHKRKKLSGQMEGKRVQSTERGFEQRRKEGREPAKVRGDSFGFQKGGVQQSKRVGGGQRPNREGIVRHWGREREKVMPRAQGKKLRGKKEGGENDQQGQWKELYRMGGRKDFELIGYGKRFAKGGKNREFSGTQSSATWKGKGPREQSRGGTAK